MILPDLSAGGAERVTITIARILKREGYDVNFLNLGIDSGEMLDWIIPEFRLTSLEKSRVLKSIPVLTSYMKNNRDAIFFSSREHVNLVSLISSKLSRVHSIVRIPNMPRNVLTRGVPGLKMNVIKSINRFFLKSAKQIIAQNEEMKNQLVEFYNLPQSLVVTINNPIDKEYVMAQAKDSVSPYDSTEVNFLNVCNIAYSKGIDVLIEAWPFVKEAIPKAHMYIVGRNTSEFAQEMENKAKNLQDFTFLGFKSNPYPFIKHCDVFVLPSRMEGFPNVVLEAMCFNKPIATTNCVKVIEEIIRPAENGYYCEIENPHELAESMIKASQLKNVSVQYNLFDKEALLKCFS